MKILDQVEVLDSSYNSHTPRILGNSEMKAPLMVYVSAAPLLDHLLRYGAIDFSCAG